ncbi:hypothetical protein PsorP6_004212 [Peronosclerospora sorghi]|uniref:Uncharacterized protein n=1 Tax=Peronosclerospora sorghi TaxID=230839 RepID=A0ACC0VP10_9STRA|nr:hypothetical protein PsorP6_004212 [Peronosclerospora sorghi]
MKNLPLMKSLLRWQMPSLVQMMLGNVEFPNQPFPLHLRRYHPLRFPTDLHPHRCRETQAP